jgi:hypothetical protein
MYIRDIYIPWEHHLFLFPWTRGDGKNIDVSQTQGNKKNETVSRRN